MLTLFVLYAARVSHLSASQIGVVFAAFGVGGVVAATALGRLVTRLGYGHTCCWPATWSAPWPSPACRS
jgi:predicted MFS family arabinose efflux permease